RGRAVRIRRAWGSRVKRPPGSQATVPATLGSGRGRDKGVLKETPTNPGRGDGGNGRLGLAISGRMPGWQASGGSRRRGPLLLVVSGLGVEGPQGVPVQVAPEELIRSEEHTSELQS